jgi:glycosyltransferase involved in cell wall biosynthesis
MHVLFVHQNFPGQFGPFAFALARRPGWRVTFVSANQDGTVRGVECLRYDLQGGATQANHYCSRTFENGVWHAHAAYEALAARPDIRPDLVVGHSGFGSTLYLRELYPAARLVNLFEYFYCPRDSDMDFRPEFPVVPLERLRAVSRNAMILLDLDACDRGYCPTPWQRSLFPAEFLNKLSVVFDGLDTELWKPHSGWLGQVGSVSLPPGSRLVTDVARGFESMRGFDIFLKAADRLVRRRPDVQVLVVGSDRIHYGGDARHIGGKSFNAWVLAQGDYALDRIHFVGPLPEAVLARVLAASQAHIYLTVPFVLSWSLLNAMACGAPVVASDTPPVRDVIVDGQTGRLVDFFDAAAIAAAVEDYLDDPARARDIGRRAALLMQDHYSVAACLPKFEHLLEGTS